MSDAQQEALLMQKANLVFSRAEPKHKQVRWRKGAWGGGEGVNIAPQCEPQLLSALDSTTQQLY